MLKKLMSGELSLSSTFWKFGILGLGVMVFVVRTFGSLLAQRLNGISLWSYYTKYFNPLHMNSGILILTVSYLVCLAIFVWYSAIIISGTWKSSAEYDKSLWLRHLSRVIILGLVFVCYNIIF